jgi:hypothetical protein
MAHFYFHFCDGETHERDEIGLGFATAEDAYLEAVAAAREMWPGLLAARSDPTRCAFEIADDNDQVLFCIPFSELMEACRKPAPPQVGGELRELIERTHRRSEAAKAGVRVGFDQVRQSLAESCALLAEFDRFARVRFRAADGREGSGQA